MPFSFLPSPCIVTWRNRNSLFACRVSAISRGEFEAEAKPFVSVCPDITCLKKLSWQMRSITARFSCHTVDVQDGEAFFRSLLELYEKLGIHLMRNLSLRWRSHGGWCFAYSRRWPTSENLPLPFCGISWTGLRPLGPQWRLLLALLLSHS